MSSASTYGITMSQEERSVSSAMSRMSLSGSDLEVLSSSSAKMTPSLSSCSIELSADESPLTSSVSSISLDEPAKLFEKELEGVCSLFKVAIKPGSKAYRYDVDMFQMDKDRQKNLTKGADDGQKALNKTVCFELMYIAFAKARNFGDSELAYVYDSRSSLYTSRPIRMNKNEIDIKISETSRFVQKYIRASGFQVTITPSSTSHVIDLSDLTQYMQKRTVDKEDRSMRTFLEMLFSHDAIMRNTYTAIGNGSLFENAEDAIMPIGNGMVLRTGLSKGVRVIENDGRPTPALVIDFKKSPFYAAQWLIDSVADMCNKQPPASPQDRIWSIIEKYYGGVRIYPSYSPSTTFAIARFTKEAMKDIYVDCDGRKVPMPEFYRRKHNINLEYHHFPAVVPEKNGKGPKRYFPIELLKVLANQRVPLEKMHEGLSKQLHKENVVKPEIRYKHILRSLHKLNLVGEENESLEKFGVKLDPHANQVRVGVRRKPSILMGGMKLRPNEKTKWTGSVKGGGVALQYAVTEPLRRWAVLYPEHMHLSNFKKFIDKVIEFGVQKGIEIAEPKFMKFEDKIEVWMEAFGFLATSGVQMVMLIDKREDKTHGKLKLFECLYKVLTQHLTFEKMMECVKGRPVTLENIINKLNCKNFGLNYTPIVEPIAQKYALERGEVLVIGYDVCHPPPLTGRERRLIYTNNKLRDLSSLEPSVVGVTANVASDPHMFIGDFFYQETRKESVDVIELSERMTWFLRLLEKNRPQHAMPPYIFIVRDGLSEGQFAMAKDEELPALKEGCKEYDPDYNPKFIFIIATKRHNKRFFAIAPDGRADSLEPGSVIDSGAVRQDVPEFFMQSHYPLQGTAKATQYGIPVDELEISQDEVQAVLNALCYEHQIVNSAVSIPEPVYQADELAKRGQDIYRELRNLIPDRIPRREDGSIDFKALNSYMCYKDSNLESTRFSA